MRRRFLGSPVVAEGSYLVISNSEGAKVYFDGELKGVIANGQLEVSIPGGNDSYTVTLEGGLPEDNISYSLVLNPTSMSFTSAGGSQSFTVTSILHTVTYKNTSGTVSNGSSVTLNWTTDSDNESQIGYSSTASGTGFSVSGTTVTAASNQSSTASTSSRTGTITVTQSTSNIQKTISLTQSGRTMYSYTVNSNCNGGTVSAGGTNRGTISSGKLVFYDTTGGSKTISISGGVPSNYTDTGSQSTTEYNLAKSSGSDSMSFSASGGSDSITVTSQYRTGTRSTSTPVTYTAPSSATCAQNSSVTMNYSSSRGSTSYGSWSYGSWANQTSSISGLPSWASSSKSTSGSSHTYTITASANSSTSSRSGSAKISNTGKSLTVSLSQSGKSITYVFTLADGTTSKSYSYDSTARSLNWTITSTADGSFTAFTVKSSNTSMATVSRSSNVVSCSLTANSSSSSRSCTLTFTQTASGKTITVTLTQAAALPSITYFNASTAGADAPQAGGSAGYQYRQWDSTGAWVAATNNIGNCSWISNPVGSGNPSSPNYKTYSFTCAANDGFTDRSFTITSTPTNPSNYSNGSSQSYSVTVNQPGLPNSFNIKNTGSGFTAYVMLNSVTVPSGVSSNKFPSMAIDTGTTEVTSIIRNINSSNTATVGAPFTLSAKSISVKIYKGSGTTTSSWTLVGTYTVTPGSTITL